MGIIKHINEIYRESELLYTTREVELALDTMASLISNRFANSNILCLTVMVGGLIPTGALLRRLRFPLQIDYVHATRYQGGTRGGELEWKAKPQNSLRDRIILIIDDILDRGVTLQGIVDYCRAEGAKEVYTAVLIEKLRERPVDALQKADFAALTVPDRYVFGYGTDYKEYLRNAPGIYAIPQQYE